MSSAARKLDVIVVDDEIPIIEQLSLFPWDSIGCSLVATARSAASALKLISSHPCDLLITDITMQGTDGIELARRVHELYPRIGVIFLTVHREFEYAQAALREGAVEYLLKGFYRDDDLRRAVERVRDRMPTDSDNDARDRSYQRLVGGDLAVSVSPELPAFLSVFFRTGSNRFASPLDSWLRNRVASTGTTVWLQSDSVYCLLVRSAARSDVEAMLTAVTKEANHSYANGDSHYFASIGPLVRSVSDLSGCQDEIVASLEGAFYADSGGVVPWANTWSRIDQETLLDLSVRFLDAIKSEENAIDYISREVPSILKKESAHPTDARLLLKRWAHDVGVEAPSGTTMTIGEFIREAERLVAQSRESRDSFGRWEVAAAVAYLRSNLSRAVTLTEVADHVQLSPNYLGAIFRQSLGQRFKWYHTKLRLERAAELLLSSGLRVYEIADQVGISNYRYFSQLFRKHFGMTPREYRTAGSREEAP